MLNFSVAACKTYRRPMLDTGVGFFQLLSAEVAKESQAPCRARGDDELNGCFNQSSGLNETVRRPPSPRLAFAIISDYVHCSAAKYDVLPDRGSVIVRISEPPLILTRVSPTASLFTRVVKQTPLVGVAYLRAFDSIY